jgi:uncharacterized protein
MKSLLAALTLLCGSWLQAQTPAPPSEKTNDIRKLIVLTGGAKIMDQMFNAMAANFKDPKQQRAFQEFRKEFDPNQIYEIMIPAYDKFLSADDVKEIIRFYESPAGAKLLDAQPKIMADAMPRIMQWSQEVSARVMQKMKEQEAK